MLGDALPYLIQVAARAALILIFAWATVMAWPRSTAAIRHRIWTAAFVGVLFVPILVALLPELRLPIMKGGQGSVAESVHGKSEHWIQDLRAPECVGDWRLGAPRPVSPTRRLIEPSLVETRAQSGVRGAPSPSSLAQVDSPESKQGVTGAASLLVGVWLTGAILLLLSAAIGSLLSHQVLRAATPVLRKDAASVFLTLSRDLGIRRPVALLQSNEKTIPMTIGPIRPSVLVPHDWFEWSPQKRRLVLLHELAHVARWDVSIQLVARLACCIHWVNPIAWYALHRLRIERELASDDCVLHHGARPSDYASQLIELSGSYKQRKYLLSAPAASRNTLAIRLRSILAPSLSRRPMRDSYARSLIVLFASLCTAVSAVELTAKDTEPISSDEPVEAPSADGTAVVTQLELGGLVSDHESNPIRAVGVFLATTDHGSQPSKADIKQIATTDDQGVFQTSVEIPTAQLDSAKIVAFKRGWSLETMGLEARLDFAIQLEKDVPIEINMRVAPGNEVDRHSVKVELARTPVSLQRDEVGRIVSDRSIAGTIDAPAILHAHNVPGVVVHNTGGGIKLHGLGVQRLASLNFNGEASDSGSCMVFVSDQSQPTSKGEAGHSIRVAAISFGHQPEVAATLPESLLAQIHAKVAEHPEGTQFALAAIKAGEVLHYGAMKRDGEVTPVENANAVFEIGSVTKVFTSHLLATQVLSGRLDLSQEIGSILKSDMGAHGGMTLAQLASHSSGLPQMSESFLESDYDESNPYEHYSVPDLLDEMQAGTLIDRDRVDKFQYSNLGVSLLGYAICESAGTDLETLLAQQIFSPAGMSTTTTVRERVQGQLVGGLTSGGEQAKNWDCNAITPAGGIYSTASDLAKYATHCFQGADETYEIQCKAIVKRSRTVDQGMGWMLLRSESGRTYSFHAGGTGGYSSLMVLEPASQSGVVLLTNVEGGDDSIAPFALNLMSALMKSDAIK